MKRLPIADPGVFFMGRLRRNIAWAMALSLLLISTAFLLIWQYEIGMDILKNKWQPCYEMRKDDFFAVSPIAQDRPADLTRYNLKIKFKSVLNRKKLGRLEIQFCDKYTLFLTDTQQKPSGVYYDETDNGVGKYASKIRYGDIVASDPQLEDLNLYLECDLREKTAGIYINDEFIEKVSLGQETRQYAVHLNVVSTDIRLSKLEIFAGSGKILFSANYEALFFYKLVSQILIFLGLLIFFALVCAEKHFLKRFLYFASILLCLEGFLRIGEEYSPNFNVGKRISQWHFAISTNLLGTYNDPEKIVIRNTFYPRLPPQIYQIPKPENTRRILCVGSSPVAGFMMSDPAGQTFPELLEKKINQGAKLRYEVITAAFFGEAYFNSLEPNVFLKEVASRLDPDLILFYMRWTPAKLAKSRRYLSEENTLYDRAKKAMEGNSAWIKDEAMLYAALEFKRPIKEIVYLYEFLCHSYVFLGLESFRHEVFKRLYYITHKPLPDKANAYFFDETLKLCREKKIKILMVIPYYFPELQNEAATGREIGMIIKENPEVYSLNLERALYAKKDFFPLGYDDSHPTEHGHMIIAEEIFRKLTQMGFIETNQDR